MSNVDSIICNIVNDLGNKDCSGSVKAPHETLVAHRMDSRIEPVLAGIVLIHAPCSLRTGILSNRIFLLVDRGETTP